MIPRGSAFGCSVFRILWAPVHISFALYILIWTWDEWTLPSLPYHSLLSVFSSIHPSLIVFFSIISLLLSLCVGFGWHTRLFQTLFAILSIPLFFHSASTYHNHYAFMLFISFFLALLPTERFFSFDARQNRRLMTPSTFQAWQHQNVELTGQYLILLQTSFLYAFAALNKTNPEWFWRWSTTPEFSYLSRDALFGPWINFLLEHHLLSIPLTSLITLMFGLSVSIFFTRRYPWIACIGILLHIFLELSLPVIIFTPMMMSIWLLALFPAEHPWIRSIEKSLTPSPPEGSPPQRGAPWASGLPSPSAFAISRR